MASQAESGCYSTDIITQATVLGSVNELVVEVIQGRRSDWLAAFWPSLRVNLVCGARSVTLTPPLL